MQQHVLEPNILLGQISGDLFSVALNCSEDSE